MPESTSDPAPEQPPEQPSEPQSEPTAEQVFDRITQTIDAPLVVVTAADGDERAGCVVGFHTQCSLDPLRYALWLSKANRTYRVALRSEYLGVHLLAAADRQLGMWFGGHSGDDVDTFSGVDVDPGPGGLPLLRQARARFAGRRVSLFDDGGDHACFIVEVGPGPGPDSAPAPGPEGATTAGSDAELLRVSDLSNIEPGHEG